MSEKKGFLSGLFGGKKSGGCCGMEIVEEGKEREICGCSCGCPTGTFPPKEDETPMKGALQSIKVLGTGCKNCHTLLENTQAALKEIGSAVAVEYVTDMAAVAGYGVMSTPALVVNEKVVSSGKVLKTNDVVNLLRKLGF